MEFDKILTRCIELAAESVGANSQIETGVPLSRFLDSLEFLHFLLELESEFGIDGVHSQYEHAGATSNLVDIADFIYHKFQNEQK